MAKIMAETVSDFLVERLSEWSIERIFGLRKLKKSRG